MLSNCGAGEDSWESLGLRRDETSQSFLKEVNPEYSLEGTDAEAEAPILWPPDMKSWLTGKDPDAGKNWGQEEKRAAEDEMAGWHHWLDGRESEWTLGVDDGQGGLGCCDSWGRKELDTTEWLNWTELIKNMKWLGLNLFLCSLFFYFYFFGYPTFYKKYKKLDEQTNGAR